MRVVGIGVDLMVISRMESLIHRRGAEAIARRILSPPESIEFGASQDKVGFLASRFAIKEALFKAASSDQLRLQWKDVTISKEATGKPVATFNPIHQLGAQISVSHDGGFLAAFAMVFK